MNTPFTILPRQIRPDTPTSELESIKDQWFIEAYAACHLTTIASVTRVLGERKSAYTRHYQVRAYKLNDYTNVVAMLEDLCEGYNPAQNAYNDYTRVLVYLTPTGHPFYRGDLVATWKYYKHKDTPEPGGTYIPGDWVLPFIADAATADRIVMDKIAAQAEQQRQELLERLTITLRWE